jgi:hypothetical protein
MLTNTTTLPSPPYPGVPYNIFREWCLGDSLNVINANFAYFDSEILNLKSSRDSILQQFNLTTPSGAIMAFARTTAPNGWLECNGQLVDVANYPTLVAAIYVGDAANLSTSSSFGFKVNDSGLRVTNGNKIKLPDLRGYFIRGLGVNSDGSKSASFGVRHPDAIQSHLHTFGYRDDVNDTEDQGVGTGSLNVVTNPVGITRATGGPITDLLFDGSVRVDEETRPKNIPLLYCIKT